MSVFLVLVASTPVEGSSKGTPEAAAINRLKYFIVIYEKSHDGRLPTDWEQLSAYDAINNLNRSITFDIRDGYIFGSGRFKTVTGDVGELIILRSAPLEKKGENWGRYLIWRDDNGEIQADWISEDEVQDLLKKPEIKLFSPTPKSAGSPPAMPSPNQPQATQPVQSPADANSETAREFPPSAKPEASESEKSEVARSTEAGQPLGLGPWIFIAVVLIGALAIGLVLLRRSKNP